ncbi:Polypyrimidine tract-binding protein 1 [Schistosoma japonicum]|nr:Polypyrimidine tract-binding protein 1 [Schistosoma japonicum]
MKRHDTMSQRVLTEVPTVVDVSRFESKKARLDSTSSNAMPESRVLHLRGLPPDVSESEVAMLAIPFGSIANMILTRKSCQALVEMDTLESAESMFGYYMTVCTPNLRGKYPIEMQFSKYSSLTNATTNNATLSAIEEANKQFVTFRCENEDSPKTVLHIHVEKSYNPMEIGYLPFFMAFKPFGRILRVVSFKKNDSRHAFLEFSNSLSAHVAKLLMNGVPLFPMECNFHILRTEFSRQSTLEIHREDNSSRDFVQNPWDESNGSYNNQLLGVNGANHLQTSHQSIKSDLDDLSEEKLSTMDPTFLSVLANRLIKPLLKAATTISGTQGDVLRTQAATLSGLTTLISESKNHHDTLPWPLIPSLPVQEIPHFTNHSMSISPVAFVSNLNTEKVNPDTLFILFGVYGDVLRVKILHNKRSTALVQFTDSTQALRAVNFLNGVSLYGKIIRCVLSKNSFINMPPTNLQNLTPDGENEIKTTCDYTGHKLHRFRRANSRNHFNICAPSKVLHITNLPESISDDTLKSVFENHTDCQVCGVKSFKAEKKMALMEFANLNDAISALIAMHNYPIEENMHIRVSFSKSPL